MKIEELVPGMSISLLITVNSEHLVFESQIREVYPRKHLVLADAIIRNNKVISLHGSNLIVDVLVNTDDEKPQLFKNVTITTMKKGTTFYYNLATVAESKTYNRRESYRCYIGLESSVRLGQNRFALPIIIRDVSVNGFSIVSTRDCELMQGSLIHVVLNDFLEEIAEKFTFQMDGLVARIQELENGNFLYGCRLNSPLPGLEAYIMKKERIRLKKTNGGNL